MYSKTIPVTTEKQIELKVDGDLELRGWSKPEISVSVLRESDLRITSVEEKSIIESRSDLEIWAPEGLPIIILKVEGDAEIQDLTGALTVRGVGGDLDLNSTGETRVDSVGGDLDARKVASLAVTAVGGDCSVERVTGGVQISHTGGDLHAEDLGSLRLINVGGDCSVHNILSEFSVSNIGGDLHGENLDVHISAVTVGGDMNLHMNHGGVKALTGGDLKISIGELTPEPVDLSAGGDVSLYLPAPANAQMHISSGGRDILMRVGGWNERVEMFAFDFKLGEGTTPIQITAGGDVTVSDGGAHSREEPGAVEFAGVKLDVDAISQTVQETVERATRQAEKASREVEERIQAAMRRVEEKTRGRGFHIGFDSQPPVPPTPPIPPTSIAQPIQPAQPAKPVQSRVSDEERKLILQMLSDQKITTEEAIHLLDAIEGKNQ